MRSLPLLAAAPVPTGCGGDDDGGPVRIDPEPAGEGGVKGDISLSG
ncbi:hypothetical protein [Stakelama saccharophila]|uniref:Uncharacterized protein n=1 Tax=Stakelama saccharophila TaxID=3075605 RepID=A0ABZ0BAC2_9SPHN|nr:hypothetical protein [Stakelama sp. W311]WNO54225.1 hypothetical protein RPR59_02895 [Stakelama sp. W311]